MQDHRGEYSEDTGRPPFHRPNRQVGGCDWPRDWWIRDQRWRQVEDGPGQDRKPTAPNWQRLPALAAEHPGRKDHALGSAAIGYVEFNDAGELHDARQMAHVLGKVASLADAPSSQSVPPRPLLLVLFIHGWKHNAAETDCNVQDFKTFLQDTQLDEDFSQVGAPRQVVGIYAGWRGLSLNVRALREITFSDRRSAAERIGGKGLRRLIAGLEGIRRGSASNRLICVGHSLGGAMLYRGVEHRIVETFLQQIADQGQRDSVRQAVAKRLGQPGSTSQAKGAAGAPVRQEADPLAADLVILLNPAIEGEPFRALHQAVAEHSPHFTDRQAIVFSSFTTMADRAIGRWFRLATGRRSYGFDPDFLTAHVAVAPEGPDGRCDARLVEPERFNQAARRWRAFREGVADQAIVLDVQVSDPVGGQRGRAQGESVPTHRHMPILNASVVPALIASHNKIWEAPFLRFLRVLIGVRFAVRPAPGNGAQSGHVTAGSSGQGDQP